MTVLIIVAVLLWLFFFCVFPGLRRHKDLDRIKGQYIAHRGLHSLESETPENSMPAFRAALHKGYWIETDLHVTADGAVVVFHDDDTMRMCGVAGTIEKRTLAEVKELRLNGTDCCIPTLGELLDLVDGQVGLLIEFKCVAGNASTLCTAAQKLLDDYKGLYLIQSFYPQVLLWYRWHKRSVCRGQLSAAFRDKNFAQRLLGCLLFNFLGRPDFVSYQHSDKRHFCRRLVTCLGAYPIGWTFESQQALSDDGEAFKTWIFEQFIP